MRLKEYINESIFDDFGNSLTSKNKGLQYYIKNNNLNIISEAGLSRLLKVYKEGKTFAIITAYREKDKHGKLISKKDKIKANRRLRTELNSLKMGIYQLVGHWRGEEGDVIERSYFVPKRINLTDDEFEKIILRLIRKYNQEGSLLYRDSIVYILWNNGKKEKTDETLTLGKISQAYSQYIGKPNIPFVFEGIEQPNTIIARIGMNKSGILWLED